MNITDIDAIRADTPACEALIHFNNAGASLMPLPVQKAVAEHLDLEANIGGYEAEHRAQNDLQSFYTEFATLLNASADEIAYVENATRAWDMAFYALPLKDGDRILTHESEYVSNYLALLQQAKRRNLHIDLIPSDEHGQIDVTKISDLVTDKTKLIAVTHVPTQGGLVNPVREIGNVAKEHGLIYLIDACQSTGQIALDVRELQCDVLTGTGRKYLRGPRGTGFLYVRKDFLNELDPPFIDLHSANWISDDQFEFISGTRRFENWESFVAGRVGLMQAVRYTNAIGVAQIESRVSSLAQKLRDQLSVIKEVTVHDRGLHKCGIVTLTKKSVPSESMADQLRAIGINISVSSFSSARIDFSRRKLESLARASLHYFNTEDEISRFVEAVDALK